MTALPDYLVLLIFIACIAVFVGIIGVCVYIANRKLVKKGGIKNE